MLSTPHYSRLNRVRYPSSLRTGCPLPISCIGQIILVVKDSWRDLGIVLALAR